MQTRIKTCVSRYDNSAYIRIQFLRAARYSVGAHNALVHVNKCDSDDDDDETTDAGEEVVEAQTADDQQQNDVCDVCLVAPHDTRLALVPGGFCPSCMEQVKQQQLSQMPALSHRKTDGVAFVLTIRLDG